MYRVGSEGLVNLFPSSLRVNRIKPDLSRCIDIQNSKRRLSKMFPNPLLGKVCVSSVGPKALEMVTPKRDYHENTFTPSRFISKFYN